jgi:hypothetical protein
VYHINSMLKQTCIVAHSVLDSIIIVQMCMLFLYAMFDIFYSFLNLLWLPQMKDSLANHE